MRPCLRSGPRGLTGLAVVAALSTLAPGEVLAAPEAGSTFPAFTARDVTGAERTLPELGGDRRVMIVAITDRGGRDEMRAWWQAADAYLDPDVKRVSIVSIGVPFFVSADYVRKKARAQVPPEEWSATLLDTHHELADELGLGSGDTPWVFVVDPDGRVLASAHAEARSPEARRIWSVADAFELP